MQLEQILLAWNGCVIVASHDRALLDAVAPRLLVLPGNGAVQLFDGRYSDVSPSWHDCSQPGSSTGTAAAAALFSAARSSAAGSLPIFIFLPAADSSCGLQYAEWEAEQRAATEAARAAADKAERASARAAEQKASSSAASNGAAAAHSNAAKLSWRCAAYSWQRLMHTTSCAAQDAL